MSDSPDNAGKNDENEDIYEDIGDFHIDRELSKLEESNKAYLEDVVNLSDRLKAVTENYSKIEATNDVLVANISILLKTAKCELQRKESVIDELRKEIDNFRTRKYNDRKHRNSDVCKSCAQSLRSSHPRNGTRRSSSGYKQLKENQGSCDEEEGEIVKNETEPNKYKTGRREGSQDSGSCSRRSPRRSHSRHHHRSRSSRSHRRYREESGDRKKDSKRRRSREKSREISKPSPRVDHREPSRSKRTKKEDSPKESKGNHNRGSSSHRREQSSESPRKKKAVEGDAGGGSPGKRKDSKAAEDESCKLTEGTMPPAEANLRRSTRSSSSKEIKPDVRVPPVPLANDEVEPCGEVLSKAAVVDTNKQDEEGSDNEMEKSSQSSSDEGWVLSFGKKSEPLNRHKTLYSARMEAKLKQQLEEEASPVVNEKTKEEGLQEARIEVEQEVEKVEQKEEKEEGEITEDDEEEQEEAKGGTEEEVRKREQQQQQQQREEKGGEGPAQNLAQTILKFQKGEEIREIKEFSPLKNNYKLMEISPAKKSVAKQHVLEYYNLKPAGKAQQQSNNTIDPEIFDFSFTVPVTPGKDFPLPGLGSEDWKPRTGGSDATEKQKTSEKAETKDKEEENGVKKSSDEEEDREKAYCLRNRSKAKVKDEETEEKARRTNVEGGRSRSVSASKKKRRATSSEEDDDDDEDENEEDGKVVKKPKMETTAKEDDAVVVVAAADEGDAPVLDELSMSNSSDCRVTTTATTHFLPMDTPTKPGTRSRNDRDESKPVEKCSTLSGTDESDVEPFADGSSSDSGEYSDSGASAFVDLL